MGTRILAGFLSSSLQSITPVSPLQPCSHCSPSMSPKANDTTSTPTSPTTQYLEPTRNIPQTGESSHLLLEHLTRTHILATTTLNAICTECWNMDVSGVKHLSREIRSYSSRAGRGQSFLIHLCASSLTSARASAILATRMTSVKCKSNYINALT